jgi:hypothetical protein
MAEETQNPSRNVPNAMVAAQALTYLLGYVVRRRRRLLAPAGYDGP